MAAAYVGASTAYPGYVATSVTVTPHASTATGDTVVVFELATGTTHLTAPSGWSTINPAGAYAVIHYKKLVGSDSYAFTCSGLTISALHCFTFSGLDAFDASTFNNSADGGSAFKFTSVTTANNNEYLIALSQGPGDDTPSAASSPLEIKYHESTPSGINVASGLQATAGASGEKTFTVTSAKWAWADYLLAFNEAGGGSPGQIDSTVDL